MAQKFCPRGMAVLPEWPGNDARSNACSSASTSVCFEDFCSRQVKTIRKKSTADWRISESPVKRNGVSSELEKRTEELWALAQTVDLRPPSDQPLDEAAEWKVSQKNKGLIQQVSSPMNRTWVSRPNMQLVDDLMKWKVEQQVKQPVTQSNESLARKQGTESIVRAPLSQSLAPQHSQKVFQNLRLDLSQGLNSELYERRWQDQAWALAIDSQSSLLGVQRQAEGFSKIVEKRPVGQHYKRPSRTLKQTSGAGQFTPFPAKTISSARLPLAGLAVSDISVILDVRPTLAVAACPPQEALYANAPYGETLLELPSSSSIFSAEALRDHSEMGLGQWLPDFTSKAFKKNNDEPAEPHKEHQGDPGPLFRKWPLEIRELVYEILLVAGTIAHPERLVEYKLVTLVYTESEQPSSNLGIDSTILRTCRRVYNEALPILYGRNNFNFYSPEAIKAFRAQGVVELPSPSNQYYRIPSFNFEPNQQGRLAAIRKLTIVLTNDSVRSITTSSGRDLPPRDSIAQFWQQFLREDRHPRGNVLCEVSAFLALEDLALDFSDWDLGTDEVVVHRPFVERFRTQNGLRRLEIIGVKHQSSVERLGAGLLRAGGKLVVKQ